MSARPEPADGKERFLAYVACTAAPNLSIAALASRVAAITPAMSASLAPLDLPSLEGSGFGVTFGGVPIAVIVVPAALPSTEWQAGASANRAWPGAGEAMAAHGAHVIVAPVSAPATGKEALRHAIVTTVLAAAVAEEAQAIGVCWTPAHSLVERRVFIEMARAMMAGGTLSSLPLDAWLRLEFGRMEGRYAAIARGLIPILGHDIAANGNSPDPGGQATAVYDVAGYLIRGGGAFAEGDAVEIGSGVFAARWSDDRALLGLEASESWR